MGNRLWGHNSPTRSWSNPKFTLCQYSPSLISVIRCFIYAIRTKPKRVAEVDDNVEDTGSDKDRIVVVGVGIVDYEADNRHNQPGNRFLYIHDELKLTEDEDVYIVLTRMRK